MNSVDIMNGKQDIIATRIANSIISKTWLLAIWCG